MSKEEKDYKKIAEAYEEREAEAKQSQAIRAKSRADNWLDLASHFQVKVQKRTSEVTFLQTKAGFLIAAAVVVLQIITSLPKPNNVFAIGAIAIAALLTFASLIVSIVSMHMNATAALQPDKMINDLSSEAHSNMSREQFGKWLAQSYSKANDRFNGEYSRKYKQQIISAFLLLTSLAIAVALKGISIYV